MRSAGCIVNDIVDIKLDEKVKRTSQRPLVIQSINISEAIIFLAFIINTFILILIQFNLQML